MATVYLAQDLKHDRAVALKVLHPYLATTLGPDRFLREIKFAARLQHPHILTVLDSGEAAGLLWYTMPYVEGESLRALVTRDGQLPIADTIRVLRDVVDALACAHDLGIVHRDIKPDNVLISRKNALVTDFGVAKALSEATTASSSWATTAGLVLGTPAYMAPEQATAASDLDHRVDLYAVGVLAYEMLSGHPPFSGGSPQAVLAAQITRSPEPVSRARADIPAPLANLVMRCLEKDPAARWQTGGELLKALESMPTQASPRHPFTAVALFGAASALILILARALTDWLGLPEWVFVAAVILLVIGIPIIVTTALSHRHRGPHRWLSWRKAIGGGVAAFTALGLAAAGYMLLRALGIGPVGSLLASGVIQERDRVIISDFVNRSGDPLLGGALTQAFRVDFAESPVVRPIQPDQVRQALALMARPDTVRLEPRLARELAIREGIKAVVSGEINRAGRQFIISAQLVLADSGTVVAALRERANDSTELIQATDRLSKRLRNRIGESLRSIRASPPLEQVTTSSLEALRKYSQGKKVADQGDVTRAVELLEQAVALDSGFASAYRAIGIWLGNYGQNRERQIEALSAAFKYRDRLPARERYLTTAAYYAYVNGDRARAKDELQTLVDFFPDHASGLNNLGVEYEWERDYAGAANLFRRAIAADSTNITYHANLISELVALGKVDSARAVLREARRRFPDNPLVTWYDALLFSSVGRYDSAVTFLQQIAKNRRPDPSWRSAAYGQLAGVLSLRGQISSADQMARDGASVEEQRGFPPGVIQIVAQQGLRRAVQEQGATRSEEVETALRRHPLAEMNPSDRPYLELIRFYAATQKTRQARALMSEYERAIPLPFRRNDEPARHRAQGMIALADRDGANAIAEFQAGDQGSCRICALPGLAQAYDLTGQADSALAVYQRYVATPALFRILEDGTWLPAVYYRLGELYEQRGDRAKAAEYYSRFAALWKDADASLRPRVVRAKRRLAALAAQQRE